MSKENLKVLNEKMKKAGEEKAKAQNPKLVTQEEAVKAMYPLKSESAKFFKNEIALVSETFLQEFLIDVLNKAPLSFEVNKEARIKAKEEVQLIHKLYQDRGAAKEFIYVVIVAVLIKDLVAKEPEFNDTPYHLLSRIAVQFYIKEADIDLSKMPTPILKNLFRLVESIGEMAPSEALAPKVGSAEYEIAMLLVTLETLHSLKEEK